MTKLTYTGPLRRPCGVKAPGSDRRYDVTPGQPFEVEDSDAEALLKRYAGLFTVIAPEPESRKKRGKSASMTINPDAEGEDA